MAGDIEESPFRLNFQSDSVHSGSISFGRFENEALCWERRSSFSHNRYLEEVEKYSRPGSVTEKKAYFEAHFRKRALMKQTSSLSQNGTEYQSSENDNSENMNYEYDFGSFREGSHSVNGFGSFREGSISGHFDNSPTGSILEKEVEEPECAREHTGTAYDNQHSPPCISSNVIDSIPNFEQLNSLETHPAETMNEPSIYNEPEIEETENLNAEAGMSDLPFKTVDLTVSGTQVESHSSDVSEHQASDGTSKALDLSGNHVQSESASSMSSEHLKDASDQKKTASQPKQMKSKLKSQVIGAQRKRNTSNGAPKELAAKPHIKESDVPLRPKREKMVSKNASAATSHNRPKQEVARSLKTKPQPLYRSADMESRARRPVDSLLSTSDKVATKANPIANRPKHTISSTRTGVKQNGSAFSFKSDERAEKRKEYSMKLIEKMHAKEAEIHQLQAKTQEKTEAEIKQLRRSLNFKATPIPSFYHEAGCSSDKSKGTSMNRKSNQGGRKSFSPGMKISERSSSCSEAGSHRSPSASEPLNRTEQPDDSEVSSFPRNVPSKIIPPSAARGVSRPTQAGSTHMMARKKWQETPKLANIQKSKVSDDKVIRSQEVDRKPKMSSGRSGTSVMSKDMKGVHLGRSSRMGHLAVGVAS